MKLKKLEKIIERANNVNIENKKVDYRIIGTLVESSRATPYVIECSIEVYVDNVLVFLENKPSKVHSILNHSLIERNIFLELEDRIIASMAIHGIFNAYTQKLERIKDETNR